MTDAGTDDENPSLNELGHTISAARQQNGMTQTELAKLVAVNKSTVSKWESGVQNPGRHMAALEAALGIQLTAGSARPIVQLHDLAQLSNAELVNHLARVTAEVARRLPADDLPVDPRQH